MLSLAQLEEILYMQAIEMFKESPIIVNHYVLKNCVCFHNSILDAFITTGIIGGSIYLVFILTLIKKK